jgi:methionine biosynthesis protein MetW
VSGYGVEIDDAGVAASVRNGVNVIQMDMETGLSTFEDDAFDFVILSHTLQAMRNVELIMKEMLRVGREGIVTFPNFGYWRHRLDILRGHMPVSRRCPTSGTTRPTSTCAREGFRGPVREARRRDPRRAGDQRRQDR